MLAVEDLEMNDGSEEKPYFMNRELKEILGKENVKVVSSETSQIVEKK